MGHSTANIHTSLYIFITGCSNTSDILDWRYLQLYFLLLEFAQLKTQKAAYKQAISFLHIFYFLCIFRKCIRKSLVCIFTFVFQFLCVADYMKWINETTTPTEMCTGFVESVIRFKILGNRMNVYFFVDISEKYLQYFSNHVYL